jgi:hypothetical protein
MTGSLLWEVIVVSLPVREAVILHGNRRESTFCRIHLTV